MNLSTGALLGSIKQNVIAACEGRADQIHFNPDGTFTARFSYRYKMNGATPVLFAHGVLDVLNPALRSLGLRAEIVNYHDEYPLSYTLVATFKFAETNNG